MTMDDTESPSIDPAGEDTFRIGQALTRMRLMMGRRVIGRIAIARVAPGLDLSQLDLLEVVRRIEGTGGEATVGAIADAMRLDPSRGSRLVADMVSRGMLRRDASQEDGRRSLIQITDQGQTLLREIRVVKQSAVEQATADWTNDERQAFATLFERFMDRFEETRLPLERAEDNRPAD
jgi:DNA-binding MarR family transcriptional regulator